MAFGRNEEKSVAEMKGVRKNKEGKNPSERQPAGKRHGATHDLGLWGPASFYVLIFQIEHIDFKALMW